MPTPEQDRRRYETEGGAAVDLYALPLEQPEVPQLPEERPSASPKARRHVRARIAVTPFGVVGAVAVTLLLVLMIFGYVRLYATTTEVSKLEDEVTSLESENAILSATYESRIDLNEIERIAVNELGMSQPSSSQTVYLNLDGVRDQAEIFTTKQENPLKTVWAALKSGVEDILAYFS